MPRRASARTGESSRSAHIAEKSSPYHPLSHPSPARLSSSQSHLARMMSEPLGVEGPSTTPANEKSAVPSARPVARTPHPDKMFAYIELTSELRSALEVPLVAWTVSTASYLTGDAEAMVSRGLQTLVMLATCLPTSFSSSDRSSPDVFAPKWPMDIRHHERSIYSQNGEDGILHHFLREE